MPQLKIITKKLKWYIAILNKDNKEMMNNIVVGGNPFKNYTGTETFTGLRIVGSDDTLTGASRIYNDNYEKCGGLIMIINAQTGKEEYPVFSTKK